MHSSATNDNDNNNTHSITHTLSFKHYHTHSHTHTLSHTHASFKQKKVELYLLSIYVKLRSLHLPFGQRARRQDENIFETSHSEFFCFVRI